ncbi:MAG TPA: GatB/YqeY domain-containing protein [Chitinophagales bacterium]|nr:GatB/YqeY domain-containing protein [Chitinophagales bacterium]
MSLFDQVNEGIKDSMKNKQEGRLRALRGIKAALLLAKTEKGAEDTLTEAKEMQVLTKMMKQREESYTTYTQQNRPDLAAAEKEEMDVIATFLPQQMSAEELRAEVSAIITQLGATGMKDMGRVMGTATKQLAGKTDGDKIAVIVKEILGTA